MSTPLRTLTTALALTFATPAVAGLFDPPDRAMYIVQIDGALLDGGGISAATASLLSGIGAPAAVFEYDTVLTGFAAPLTAREAVALARLPGVRRVERDRPVSTGAVQGGAVYGLDRIDQDDLPLDGRYGYPDSAGEGVAVYVIDTGINPDHVDFGGRVVGGQNFVIDGPLGIGGLLPVDVLGILGYGEVDPEAWADCNGHGTHVAGTAAGATYGVAKSATLHAIRVLNCGGSGSSSGVIAGMEWVAENAQRPAVVNMSLGGGASEAQDEAIKALFRHGILPVVAAGNDDADACGSSPARAPGALTVGSTDSEDRESSFSNHGECVDIFAPGTDIESADHSDVTATTVLSGTSMASPHVAGAAAVVLGEEPGLSPDELTERLLDDAAPGRLELSPADGGSPNLLLQVR